MWHERTSHLRVGVPGKTQRNNEHMFFLDLLRARGRVSMIMHSPQHTHTHTHPWMVRLQSIIEGPLLLTSSTLIRLVSYSVQ